MSKKVISLNFVSESEKGVIYHSKISVNPWFGKPKIVDVAIFLQKWLGGSFHSFADDAQTGNSVLDDSSFSMHMANLIEHTHKTTKTYQSECSIEKN